MDDSILRELSDMLHRENGYVKLFACAAQPDMPELDIIIAPCGRAMPPQIDSGDILGAVVSDGENLKRHIVVRYRDGGKHIIAETNGAYYPLQFPLIFWLGEPAWHGDMDFAGNYLARGVRVQRMQPRDINLDDMDCGDNTEGDVDSGDAPEGGRKRGPRTNISLLEWFRFHMQIHAPDTFEGEANFL